LRCDDVPRVTWRGLSAPPPRYGDAKIAVEKTMRDAAGAQPDPDPREADVKTAQEVDPKSGYSDDPRVDPRSGGG
jgi:hypothetical protein